MTTTATRELAIAMQNYNVLGDLFDELVPEYGPADTVAGEMVRAASRIAYRYTNDGDMLNSPAGIDTVNAAARYLLDQFHDESMVAHNIRSMIDASKRSDEYMYVWFPNESMVEHDIRSMIDASERFDEYMYVWHLRELLMHVRDYIDKLGSALLTPNSDDMLSHSERVSDDDPLLDDWDDDDDDDWDEE